MYRADQATIENTKLADFKLSFIFLGAHRRKVEQGWFYPLHDHPVFELNLVVEGTQLFTLEGQLYEMKAGDLLFIKPNEVHCSNTSKLAGMTYICIHFGVDDPELRYALCKLRDSIHREGSPLWEAVYPLLMKIGTPDSAVSVRGEDKLASLTLFLDLISSISKLIADPSHKLFEERNRIDKLAAQIADRISWLANEKPEAKGEVLIKHGIQKIAEELGYHPVYCSRIFKSVYGVSPREFLSDLKIRESKLLLMDRKISIEQIALRLGFRDASHFSKQFKRWTKLSPSEYRHML